MSFIVLIKSVKILIMRKGTAGATVARSTPDRKVIRSNRVWFNYFLNHFCAIFGPFPWFLMSGAGGSEGKGILSDEKVCAAAKSW